MTVTVERARDGRIATILRPVRMTMAMTATATVDRDGRITEITITNPGPGYPVPVTMEELMSEFERKPDRRAPEPLADYPDDGCVMVRVPDGLEIHQVIFREVQNDDVD